MNKTELKKNNHRIMVNIYSHKKFILILNKKRIKRIKRNKKRRINSINRNNYSYPNEEFSLKCEFFSA